MGHVPLVRRPGEMDEAGRARGRGVWGNTRVLLAAAAPVKEHAGCSDWCTSTSLPPSRPPTAFVVSPPTTARAAPTHFAAPAGTSTSQPLARLSALSARLQASWWTIPYLDDPLPAH